MIKGDDDKKKKTGVLRPAFGGFVRVEPDDTRIKKPLWGYGSKKEEGEKKIRVENKE